MRRLPSRGVCDVLGIPAKTYQDIIYFEIDGLLTNILPPCIYVKINAGKFGATSIFNTRNFDYYKTGLSDITNRINLHARKSNKSFYEIAVYNGTVLTRPQKLNDGTPENYYLEMILSESGIKVPAPVKLPDGIKKQKQKDVGDVEKYIRDRIKKTRAAQSKFKPLRSKVNKSIELMKQVSKNEFLKKSDRENAKKQIYSGILKKIEKWRSDQKITDRTYRNFIRQVKDAYSGKNKGRKK